MSKFNIGQRVVAVRDHSQGFYKKGQQFNIHGIRPPDCKCLVYSIDIGIKTTSSLDRSWCPRCDVINIVNDNKHWFFEDAFAPIEPRSVEIDEAIIQQAKELINVREVVKETPQPVHN